MPSPDPQAAADTIRRALPLHPTAKTFTDAIAALDSLVAEVERLQAELRQETKRAELLVLSKDKAVAEVVRLTRERDEWIESCATACQAKDELAEERRLAVDALQPMADEECLLPVEAGGSCSDLYPAVRQSWCVPCYAADVLASLCEQPAAGEPQP